MTKTDWRSTKTGQTWLRLYGHRKKVKTTRIAYERLRRGLSAPEAAREVGVPEGTWKGWEVLTSRRRTPRGDLAVKVACFLDIPADLLYSSPFVTVEPNTLKEVKHDPAA